MPSTARMVFTGRFQPLSFGAFVRERAVRLDLDAAIEELGAARVAVSVTGQAGLVDAFEMACSLGPIDSLVLGVARLDTTPEQR
jgi:acylphosphatase